LGYLYSPVVTKPVVQMLPFQTLLTINKQSGAPVYQQISNGLINLIREGVIKPGAALPGSREMALLLKVHRKTIVAAYQELFMQDWIETIPRKGVIVSQRLPEIKPRSFKAAARIPAYAGNTGFTFNKTRVMLSSAARAADHRLIINDGFPDHRLAPIDLLMREYRSLYNSPGIKRYAAYGSALGPLSLRTAMVQFLSESRGLNITPGNVLLTHGARDGHLHCSRDDSPTGGYRAGGRAELFPGGCDLPAVWR